MSKWLEEYKRPEVFKQTDEYKALFDNCSARINKFWSTDIHQFGKTCCSDIVRLIYESEARLDRLWGNVTLNEFRQEFEWFYMLHKVIKALKKIKVN